MTNTDLCRGIRKVKLRVDVLGEVPLGIDVALLRTLGLLSVEVPRDVVVVQGDGFDRFIAAATTDRD